VLVGIKEQLHEGGRRILLGENRVGGAVTLRRSRYRFVVVLISMASLVYIYTVEHVSNPFHQAPDLWNLTTA
jgi:hypothetical protein